MLAAASKPERQALLTVPFLEHFDCSEPRWGHLFTGKNSQLALILLAVKGGGEAKPHSGRRTVTPEINSRGPGHTRETTSSQVLQLFTEALSWVPAAIWVAWPPLRPIPRLRVPCAPAAGGTQRGSQRSGSRTCPGSECSRGHRRGLRPDGARGQSTRGTRSHERFGLIKNA